MSVGEAARGRSGAAGHGDDPGGLLRAERRPAETAQRIVEPTERAGADRGRSGPIGAGALVMTLPVLVVFLPLQRYFIAGITSGAVK